MCSVLFVDQKDETQKWVMMKTLKSVIQTLFFLRSLEDDT